MGGMYDSRGRQLSAEEMQRAALALRLLQEMPIEQRGLVLCWFCKGCDDYIGPGDYCYCERDD